MKLLVIRGREIDIRFHELVAMGVSLCLMLSVMRSAGLLPIRLF